MEVTTKYNIGDEVFCVDLENKNVEYTNKGKVILIKLREEIKDDGTKITLIYYKVRRCPLYPSDSPEDFDIILLEAECYATRDEAKAAAIVKFNEIEYKLLDEINKFLEEVEDLDKLSDAEMREFTLKLNEIIRISYIINRKPQIVLNVRE